MWKSAFKKFEVIQNPVVSSAGSGSANNNAIDDQLLKNDIFVVVPYDFASTKGITMKKSIVLVLDVNELYISRDKNFTLSSFKDGFL